MIPLEASLYHAVVKEGAMVQALRMPGEQDGHNRPLSEEEKEWHMGMVQQDLTDLTLTLTLTLTLIGTAGPYRWKASNFIE